MEIHCIFVLVNLLPFKSRTLLSFFFFIQILSSFMGEMLCAIFSYFFSICATQSLTRYTPHLIFFSLLLLLLRSSLVNHKNWGSINKKKFEKKVAECMTHTFYPWFLLYGFSFLCLSPLIFLVFGFGFLILYAFMYEKFLIFRLFLITCLLFVDNLTVVAIVGRMCDANAYADIVCVCVFWYVYAFLRQNASSQTKSVYLCSCAN